MPFFGYLDQFSNSPVQQAYSSILNLNLTAATQIQLEWSFQNPNTLYPFSQGIYVTANPSNTSSVSMPDASFATISQTIVVYNVGAQTIQVKGFTGTALGSVANGTAWYFWCVDNTTQAGIWASFQLGAGTSSVVAASLIDPTSDANSHSNAGGLKAFGNYIKQNYPINLVTPSTTLPYTQNTGDRGSLLVWTAGSGIYNCMAAATAGAGFNFMIYNAPGLGGEISITPAVGDFINVNSTNANPFILNEGSSAYFACDGEHNFYTIANSQANNSQFTENLIDVSLGNQTVTSEKAESPLQKFTGTFGVSGATVIITYPAGVPAQYYFWNTSSNPVSAIIGGGSGFIVGVGQTLIAFTDGTTLYNAPTTLLFADGAAATPSVTFLSDQTTGVFKGTGGGTYLGFAQGGVQTLALSTAAGAVSAVKGSFPSLTLSSSTNSIPALTITSTNGSATQPSILFNPGTSPTGGIYMTTGGVLTFEVGGSAILGITATGISLSFPLGVPNGSVSNPGLFFGSTVNNGFYFATPAIGVALGGVNSFTFSPTYSISAVPLRAPAGSISNVGIGFTVDNDTGFYYTASSNSTITLASNNVNIFTAGAENAPAFINMQVAMGVIAGSAAAPGLYFGSSPGVGLFLNGSAVGITVAGAGTNPVLNIATTFVTATVPYVAPIGVSSGIPGFCFTSNTNYGLGLNSSTLELVIAGSSVLSVSSANVVSTAQILAPNTGVAYSFSGNTTWGIGLAGGALQITTSGAAAFLATNGQNTSNFQLNTIGTASIPSYLDSGLNLYSVMRACG